MILDLHKQDLFSALLQSWPVAHPWNRFPEMLREIFNRNSWKCIFNFLQTFWTVITDYNRRLQSRKINMNVPEPVRKGFYFKNVM